MSLVTRAIILSYRAELSARPDGRTHVMDIHGITHIVLGVSPYRRTACKVVVEDDRDMCPVFTYASNGTRQAVPTWNDVDCMTCLARRTP